jgi:hypothetical protein
LKAVYERDYSGTGGVFEESVPANIVFRMSLREDHPLDDSLKTLLDSELLNVQCGELSVNTRFSAPLSGRISGFMI